MKSHGSVWSTSPRADCAAYVHEHTLKKLSDLLGLSYSTINVIAKDVAEARNAKNEDLASLLSQAAGVAVVVPVVLGHCEPSAPFTEECAWCPSRHSSSKAY